MLPGLRYEVDGGSGEGVTEWQPVYVDAVNELTRRVRQVLEALGT